MGTHFQDGFYDPKANENIIYTLMHYRETFYCSHMALAIGLDKGGYPVNIFPISLGKHMLRRF